MNEFQKEIKLKQINEDVLIHQWRVSKADLKINYYDLILYESYTFNEAYDYAINVEFKEDDEFNEVIIFPFIGFRFDINERYKILDINCDEDSEDGKWLEELNVVVKRRI